MTRWHAVSLFGIIIVVAALALFFIPKPAQAPGSGTATGSTHSTSSVQASSPQATTTMPASLDDLIVVDTPLPGSVIDLQKPLLVEGRARGTWYFEASFPVEVIPDEPGPGILGETSARAQADWMTSEFVPFSATINFVEVPKNYYSGKKGWIILKNDNPSGDPAKQKELDIPIVFK